MKAENRRNGKVYRNRGALRLLLLFVMFAPFRMVALEPEPGSCFIRVVDVGAGHAAVVKFPNGDCMIYDAGNYKDNGNTAIAAVRQLAGDKSVELMVLSHTDADHYGAVKKICDEYRVRETFRSGLARTTATWTRADKAIRDEAASGQGKDLNLKFFSGQKIRPGLARSFGEAKVTFLIGYHLPPANWGLGGDTSKTRNAGSIVVRLEYRGRSVLFTGDAVGRKDHSHSNSIIATERTMVANDSWLSIDSDVLIAGHHGADNATSLPFLRRVTPTYVIFPAGDKYGHPRHTTAERCLAAGIPIQNLYRTDLGDGTSDSNEWKFGNSSVGDRRGDDDVDILIRANGELEVEYRSPGNNRWHEKSVELYHAGRLAPGVADPWRFRPIERLVNELSKLVPDQSE